LLEIFWMGTLIRRLSRLTTAAVLAAGIAACGADVSSPTAPTNIAPNGTTITVDSVISAQTAIAGDTIQVFVRVKTAAGAAIPGDTVTWNVATGGGSVPNKTSVTDANGIAATPWVLGIVAGANSLGANITGAAVPINATGIAGPLALLEKQSPDSQTVTATGSVLLTLKATDVNGNAIPNVVISWSVTGGLVSPVTSITGTSGNASVNFTTPTGVTYYIVFANAAGLPNISGITYIIKAL
jgi:adhesin/invasin